MDEQQQVAIPPWLEESFAKLPGGLADTFRRLYRLSAGRTDEEIARWEEERRQKAIERAMLAVGIPQRLVEAVDRMERTQALAEVGRYEGGGLGRGELLVLSGKTGIGKSSACAWLVWSLLDRRVGKSMAWAYAPKWFAAARAGHVDETPEARSWLLILDDLGLEESAGAKARMDELVYYRHGNKLPTVVTTNLDAAGLASRYGERTLDRMVEWGQIVEIGGRSLRVPAA